jgi:hypothetical protein
MNHPPCTLTSDDHLPIACQRPIRSFAPLWVRSRSTSVGQKSSSRGQKQRAQLGDNLTGLGATRNDSSRNLRHNRFGLTVRPSPLRMVFLDSGLRFQRGDDEIPDGLSGLIGRGLVVGNRRPTLRLDNRLAALSPGEGHRPPLAVVLPAAFPEAVLAWMSLHPFHPRPFDSCV